jgi:hypothetical protein
VPLRKKEGRKEYKEGKKRQSVFYLPDVTSSLQLLHEKWPRTGMRSLQSWHNQEELIGTT